MLFLAFPLQGFLFLHGYPLFSAAHARLCCYHSHLCVSVPPVPLPKPASWILTPLDLSLCKRLGCTTGILWMVSSIHSSLSGGLAHSASETYKFWSNFKCTSQKSGFCPSPKIYFCPQQTFVSSLVWLFPCISGGQAPFFTIYLLQFYMFNFICTSCTITHLDNQTMPGEGFFFFKKIPGHSEGESWGRYFDISGSNQSVFCILFCFRFIWICSSGAQMTIADVWWPYGPYFTEGLFLLRKHSIQPLVFGCKGPEKVNLRNLS